MSDDTNGHGPDSQHPSDTPATPLRAKAYRGHKPPPAVLQLRVAIVARALVDGMGRAAVMQKIAEDQTAEAAERARARADGVPDGAELNGVVALVWGDDALSERTVDNYIARAKEMIGEEGKRIVTRHREYVVAVTLARYTEVFQLAVAGGKLSTARMVLRDIAELFSVKDAIKAMQLADATAQRDASKPENLGTDEGKASVMSSLITMATAKDPGLRGVLAAFAALESVPNTPADVNKKAPMSPNKSDTSNKNPKK